MPGDNIPESMGEDFSESLGEDISEQPGAIISESMGGFPRNQHRKPVIITALLDRGARKAGLKGNEIKPKDLAPADAERFSSYKAAVRAANALYARHAFDGCPVPAIHRKFQGSFDLGGRFFCVGKDNFQNAKKTERPSIRIDGFPMAHIDVRAAHLSIACAAIGHPITEEDPYAVPNVDRDIVKAFVTAVLGNGSVQWKWPPDALTDEQRTRAGDIMDVAAKVCRVYPFLSRSAAKLAGPLGLTAMSHIGDPKTLLPFRLQAAVIAILIEAEGLASAMEELWASDIPQ